VIFNQTDFSNDVFYSLMSQVIIPRPIAWVLTQNPNNTFNVAPFSFFNGVASDPPILMISVGWKDEGIRKDTWVNIDERNDFVVHIPPAEMGDSVVATSKTLPFNESEADLGRLKMIPVEGEKLPRLEGPKAALFCRKHKIIEVGADRQGLILGEIMKIWVDDAAVTPRKEKFSVDPKKLNPLSRLGGQGYGLLGEVINISRPK
jgi:flavin reductase (DIM6/NTAB) family NADH-FMN oxidoreductase RutF